MAADTTPDPAEASQSMANLGYIGLGAMGGRMANRLIDKGHTSTGYKRTRTQAQWLTDRWMKWADSPRAVAENSDVIMVMVTDSKSLDAVSGGPDGFLAGL